jgi:hypothetical protein
MELHPLGGVHILLTKIEVCQFNMFVHTRPCAISSCRLIFAVSGGPLRNVALLVGGHDEHR